MQTIYLVRHCQATGQAIDAPLTDEGVRQAEELKNFLIDLNIERIISSPFLRAQESIRPLAEARNLHIELNDRLSERILASGNLPNWYELLKQSFEDKDRALPGGESSNEALQRGKAVLDELIEKQANNVVLVSHGNLLALLLHSIDNSYGFEEWVNLTNPDVYKIEINGLEKIVTRVWE